MTLNRPTGTVTFLYTDIEGSTRRWEQYPQEMKAAVERHDAIMREAIEAHGGVVFRTMGDAFCAVFTTASEGVAAALAAQRALAAEDWSRYFGDRGSGASEESRRQKAEGSNQGLLSASRLLPSSPLELRVRMALHTGLGEVREGDYVGVPLNRIARLLAIGYGGQTLLSEAAYELARDALSMIGAGVGVRDLGMHRLKDLDEAEHVYQVVVPDLPADFPPLKSLESRPNNLPAQSTPFVGRSKEVAAVRELLLGEDARLVTLLGPGGMGKTRLALQVGAELIDEFQDGVFFVDLATIREPGLVVSQIAQTLAVRETGGLPLVDSLKEYLRDKQMLLLLDNFEQVVDAAPAVAELLASAPQLKVLATSRAGLHLRGEHEFSVPPLSMPAPDALPPLEELAEYEAVALFVQRARRVQPGFELTEQNAPSVAEICYRLDGLPLAIELAAARIRLLPPEALLGRLGSRLKLLTGGARDLPARQQTLRSTIEWSFDMLDVNEQVTFRRLAVFVGGFTLDAAEAMCNAGIELGLSELDLDVLQGIESLVDKSLLRAGVRGQGSGVRGRGQPLTPDRPPLPLMPLTPGEGPRFGMLEVIREYGLDRLAESGEESAARRAHAHYYLRLAEDAEPKLSGPEQVEWLRRLEMEHGNIRAALDWGQTAEGGAELGLCLSGALLWFWQTRGYVTEGRERLAILLARPEAATHTDARAKALLVAGRLAYLQGDYAAAKSHFEENLAIWREKGDRHSISHALIALGSAATGQGEYAAARSLYEESLGMQEELREKPYVAIALAGLGEAMLYQDEYGDARPLVEQSLSLFREVGNPLGAAFALSMLGQVAQREGDFPRAAQLFEESLTMRHELGSKQGVAQCLLGLAEVACDQDLAERAIRLLGAARSLLDATGVRLGAWDQARFERTLAAARTQVGEAPADLAWAEGQAMSIDQAIEYATQGRGVRG